MWGNGKKKSRPARVNTLIGQQTEVHGDVRFSGGLHVDGKVVGNILVEEDDGAMLTLSEEGEVEGEVRVPRMTINGTVRGDVYASERIELAPRARIHGNVYYNLIEMAMGAEVNGNLVHSVPDAEKPRLVYKNNNQEQAPESAESLEIVENC